MNGLRIGVVLMFLATSLVGCSSAHAPIEADTVVAPHITAYEGLEPDKSIANGEFRLHVGDAVPLVTLLDDTSATYMAEDPSGTAEAGVYHDGFVIPIPESLAEGVIPIPESTKLLEPTDCVTGSRRAECP